jgi:hypothetical protein
VHQLMCNVSAMLDQQYVVYSLCMVP